MLSSHGGRGHNKERIKGISKRERGRLKRLFSFEEEENFKMWFAFNFTVSNELVNWTPIHLQEEYKIPPRLPQKIWMAISQKRKEFC